MAIRAHRRSVRLLAAIIRGDTALKQAPLVLICDFFREGGVLRTPLAPGHGHNKLPPLSTSHRPLRAPGGKKKLTIDKKPIYVHYESCN